MRKLLPKWVMKRYLFLLQKVKDKKFDFDTAVKHLSIFDDSKPTVSLFLSDLKKAGWLNVEINQHDARKRVYSLKPYDEMFKEIVSEIKVENGVG